MRITSKGQVSIPQEIREKAGLLPNTEADFILDGDLVWLVKATEVRDRLAGGGPLTCCAAMAPRSR